MKLWTELQYTLDNLLSKGARTCRHSISGIAAAHCIGCSVRVCPVEMRLLAIQVAALDAPAFEMLYIFDSIVDTSRCCEARWDQRIGTRGHRYRKDQLLI